MKKQIPLFINIGALVNAEQLKKSPKSAIYKITINGVVVAEVRARKKGGA